MGCIKKISGLSCPEGIAAEVELPSFHSLDSKQWIVVLDGLADPGNLGTLLRTALALNWEGIFLTPSTVDPFNDKAIRASKGACFLIPLQQGSYEELDLLIKKRSQNCFVADMQGEDLYTLPPLSSAILILGNEAKGASWYSKEKGRALSIPLADKMESLNVASAGAICLFNLKKKL